MDAVEAYIQTMAERLRESIGAEKAIERLDAIEEMLMVLDNVLEERELFFGVLLSPEEVVKELAQTAFVLAGMLGYPASVYIARQRQVVGGAKRILAAGGA